MRPVGQSMTEQNLKRIKYALRVFFAKVFFDCCTNNFHRNKQKVFWIYCGIKKLTSSRTLFSGNIIYMVLNESLMI